MTKSRHREVTRGLRDRKRLYWNLRRFHLSRRRSQTRNKLLGLVMPVLSFWKFLNPTSKKLWEVLFT